MLPEFVASYFRSIEVWRAVAHGSKGLGDHRQRVQPEQILRHEVWLPPIPQQRVIQSMFPAIFLLRCHQAETAADLEALLPAVLDRAFAGELEAAGLQGLPGRSGVHPVRSGSVRF